VAEAPTVAPNRNRIATSSIGHCIGGSIWQQ